MCNTDQTYQDTRVLEMLTSDRREPSAHGVLSLWEMIRLVNLLIVFRFLRIIPDIKVRSQIQTRRLSEFDESYPNTVFTVSLGRSEKNI